MLTRRIALLQQYSIIKNVYLGKATKAKVESELAYPVKTQLPIPKPKNPRKEPFVKGFFIGRFDEDLLTYPEPQTDERHREFMEWLQPIEMYMKTVDARKIYESSSFPTEMSEKLKKLEIYGGRIPYDYDGLNLLDSEYLRLIETLSIVPKVGLNFIQCNNFAVELLKKHGTVEQKYEYLRKIATGQYFPVICANETGSKMDPEKLQFTALLSHDETSWILNGEKIFLQQDNNANIFIVYAFAQLGGDKRKLTDTISTFIVDRYTPGIGECIPVKSPWLGSENMFSVKFDEVIIPYQNLIGEIGSGYGTLEKYLTNEVHFSAGVYISILKNYLNSLTQHVINDELYERESMKRIISRTATSLYAMESMAYMTTSLADLYEEQDLIVEKAIVKDYCSRECIKRLQDGFAITDSHFQAANYPLEQVMRNHMFGLQGNTDLKTYIGLLGLQYAGKTMNTFVTKARNPTDHPHFTLKRFLGLTHNYTNLHLEEYLHPSFRDHTYNIDKSISLLENSTKNTFVRYGIEATTAEMDIWRLSEMATLIYAMTAVFGRASRSYCIGLRNAQIERGLAIHFATEARKRIDRLAQDLEDGEFLNGNGHHRDSAQHMYDKKSYCFEHPLERNW